MSQRSYARERGLSRAMLARLEAGAGRMSLDTVVKALDGTGFVLQVGFSPDHPSPPPADGAARAGLRPTSGRPPRSPGPRPARPRDLDTDRPRRPRTRKVSTLSGAPRGRGGRSTRPAGGGCTSSSAGRPRNPSGTPRVCHLDLADRRLRDDRRRRLPAPPDSPAPSTGRDATPAPAGSPRDPTPYVVPDRPGPPRDPTPYVVPVRSRRRAGGGHRVSIRTSSRTIGPWLQPGASAPSGDVASEAAAAPAPRSLPPRPPPLRARQRVSPTRTGSLTRVTPKASRTPSRTWRARATTSDAVAEPRLVRASVCLVDRRPGPASRSPCRTPPAR